MPIASIDAWIYVAALYLLLLIVPGGITLLKGQVAAFILGILTLALVWMIAALRLAKPHSQWARWFYDDEKLRRAHKRYG